MTIFLYAHIFQKKKLVDMVQELYTLPSHMQEPQFATVRQVIVIAVYTRRIMRVTRIVL